MSVMRSRIVRAEWNPFEPPCVRYLGGGRIYYVTAESVRYRIYDFAAAEGRRVRVTAGAERAVWRVFVHALGVRKVYRFQRGESHELTTAHLERQLQQARVQFRAAAPSQG